MTKTYVVFDFETTGLDAAENQIIEVAAAKLDENLEPITTWSTYVGLSEGMELTQFIKNLTGIYEDDLEGQPDEAAVLKELRNYIGDSIVVAQFASFDLSYLAKEYVPEQFICTRSMARLLRPTESASLANLVQRYGVTNLSPHRAYSDVEATIQVFGHLLEECEAEGIEYMNVLVDSEDRPLKYIPDNAKVILV